MPQQVRRRRKRAKVPQMLVARTGSVSPTGDNRGDVPNEPGSSNDGVHSKPESPGNSAPSTTAGLRAASPCEGHCTLYVGVGDEAEQRAGVVQYDGRSSLL